LPEKNLKGEGRKERKRAKKFRAIGRKEERRKRDKVRKETKFGDFVLNREELRNGTSTKAQDSESRRECQTTRSAARKQEKRKGNCSSNRVGGKRRRKRREKKKEMRERRN